MTEEDYILVVDDSSINREILEESLVDEFEFASVASGEECLQSISKRKPALILLDVMMPEMSGLEVCRQLKEEIETAEIPVIFVSALMSDEDRLNGYAAGGDDYICKPFNEDELKVKIQLNLNNAKQKQLLQVSSNMAMQTAMTAMTSASELGLVLRFMQESFNCNDFSALAEKVFECLQAYELDGSLMLLDKETPTFYFSDQIDRPLERAVLEQVHSGGRILDFGNRTFLNSLNVTLLIRKMPVDDEIKGRFRDHLIVLIDGVEARVKSLLIEQIQRTRQKQVEKAMAVTKQSLELVNQKHIAQRSQTMTIITNISEKIIDMFSFLGLDEQQEQAFVEIITDSEKELDQLFESHAEIDKEFEKIIDSFKVISEDLLH